MAVWQLVEQQPVRTRAFGCQDMNRHVIASVEVLKEADAAHADPLHDGPRPQVSERGTTHHGSDP
jgi:hypothetical protein